MDFDGDGNGRVVGVTDTDLEKLDCFGTLIFNTSGVFVLIGTVTSEARPLTIGSS